MTGPQLFTAKSIRDSKALTKKEIRGVGHMWVPDRPMCASWHMKISNRIRLAWGVFTGKYDAVIW